MTSFFTVLSRKLLFKGHFWISVHSFVLEGHTVLVLIIDLLFALVFETYAGRAVWVVGELHKFMMCLAKGRLDLIMLSRMMLVASSSLVMCQLIFVSLWLGQIGVVLHNLFATFHVVLVNFVGQITISGTLVMRIRIERLIQNCAATTLQGLLLLSAIMGRNGILRLDFDNFVQFVRICGS